MTWTLSVTDLLWRAALAAIPPVLLAAGLCRWGRLRSATRHALWLGVLLWMLVGPILPSVSFSSGISSLQTAKDDGSKKQKISQIEKKVRETSSSFSLLDKTVVKPICLPTNAAEKTQCHGTASLVHAENSAEACQPTPLIREPEPKLASKTITHDDCLEQPLCDSASTSSCSSPTPPRTVARSEHHATAKLASSPGPGGPLSNHLKSDATERDTALVSKPEVVTSKECSSAVLHDEPKLADIIPTEEKPSSFSIFKTFAPADLVRRWLVGLTTVRDDFGRLPPIPVWLWVGGIILLSYLKLHGILRFRRRIRRGSAAPDHIATLVADAAQRIGLRRTPSTLMVDDRISPMIWCGRRTRLVLPTGLWAELDDVGRKAVIFHELAHVRRRDHWVCWIEEVVGALYWWNPLAWWIRARLREEADNCCDGWVTWLLPKARAEYATALLTTRQFISTGTSAMPTVGMGMITARAKRFGRRLTMVMTERTAPKVSLYGISLALALSLAGWLATPARSSDSAEMQARAKQRTAAPVASTNGPSEVEVVKGGVIVQKGSKPSPKVITIPAETPVVALAPAAPIASTTPLPPSPSNRPRTTWTRQERPRGNGGNWQPQEPALEMRLAELEKQLARLTETLDAQHGNGHGAGIPALAMAGPADRAPTPPPSHEDTPPPPRAPRQPIAGAMNTTSGSNGVVVYQLSKEKAEALTKLLIREDVPIRVRGVDGGIEVHGTPDQQAVVKAFVDMIGDDQERVVTYRLSKGKLEALEELMVRNDVPIMVNPDDDSISVHGSPPVQAAFQAFVELIEPGAQHSVQESNANNNNRENQIKREIERTMQKRARKGAHNKEANQILMEKLHEAGAQGRSEGIQREAEALRKQADELREKAEQLREKAQSLRDSQKNRSSQNSSAGQQEREAALAQEAQAFQKAAAELEARTDAIERQADEIEDAQDADDDNDSDDEDNADA